MRWPKERRVHFLLLIGALLGSLPREIHASRLNSGKSGGVVIEETIPAGGGPGHGTGSPPGGRTPTSSNTPPPG